MTQPPLIFDNPHGAQFSVEAETRTIKGIAVPFGVVGNNGQGQYRFAKGSLTWGKVKFLANHDWTNVLGVAELSETDDGVLLTAKVARGSKGDEFLALAEMGAIDGLSIGLGADAQFKTSSDGVQDAVKATIRETSATAIPAFETASITSVAASAAQKENTTMETCAKCNKVHAAGVVACEAPAAGVTFDAAVEGPKLMEKVQGLTEQLAELQKIKIPVGPGAQLQVTEEPIYRFSGTTPAPSGFDFATDLLAAAKDGDQAAFARLATFTAEHLGPRFADEPTTTADTAALNPSTYRPDMFLGQAPTPQSPLYDTFHKGSLSSVTPFFWSKLDRAATDVGVSDHTEGTDPEARDLVTAAGATVTPVPVSGKVHITREVADQGGNPQVSGLIWAEFDRSFKIALETKTAALLTAAAASATSLATIAAGATGVTAGRAVENGLLGLQFLPDGFRFTKAFGHIDLYKALANATLPKFSGDTEGEKVYPIINPQNRDGIAGSKYSFIDLAGYRMEPAASLGATSTSASNSWVADPNAVHVWNSGLTRLDKLQEKVEGWDLGVFAYFAGVVYDITGLRKIAYDPTA